MTVLPTLVDLLLLMVLLGGALPISIFLLISDRPSNLTPSIAHGSLVILSLWSTFQVLVGLLLGMAGQLNRTSVFWVELLLLILGLSLIPLKANYALSLSLSKQVQFKWSELLLLNSIVLVGLYLLVNLATCAIVDFDSLWFHLPAIARWYQSASLTLLDPTGHWIFEHPDAMGYPYNWHILSLLCLLPLRTDVLITLPVLLAWVMLGLSVYLLSQEFGASRFYSMAVTLLLLSMPFLMTRVSTAQVDLPLATMFMVSLYFAYFYHKKRSPLDFFLFMSSAGMLIGIKIPGLFYAALAGIFLAVLEIFRHFSHPHLVELYSQGKKGFIVAGWLTLIFLGGYWYVHNFRENAIALGNLISIKIASIELVSSPKPSTFKAIVEKLSEYQQSTLTQQFSPTNLTHWKNILLQATSRFQLPFIALVLQLIFLPYVWFRYPKRCWRQPFISALALFLLSWFLYWNTPYSSGTAGLSPGELSPLMGYNMRYGFPFLAMAAVMAAVVATVVRTSHRAVVMIGCLSGLLGIISTSLFNAIQTQTFTGEQRIWPSRLVEQVFTQPRELLVFGISLSQEVELNTIVLALIYSVSSVSLLWLWYKSSNTLVVAGLPISNHVKKPSNPGLALICAAIVSVVFIMLLVGVGGYAKQQSQATVYQGLHEYLEQTVGANNKIAYFSSTRNYLLYGKHLQQPVVHRSPEFSEPERWLEDLRQESVKFVAIGPDSKVGKQSPQGSFLQNFLQMGILKADFGRDPSKELVIFRVR
jgi:hypothetical protein